MADRSALSGGVAGGAGGGIAGGAVHDNLEPDLEVVDAGAVRPDAQARRYAHTLRRGATSTPALGTRTTSIAQAGGAVTVPSSDRGDVSTIAMPKLPPPEQRDISTIEMPKLARTIPRSSTPIMAARLAAEPRDSDRVALPTIAPLDEHDSAGITVPVLEARDPRDGDPTAVPRFVADRRDSAPIAAPTFVADRRDSAPIAAPRAPRAAGTDASIAEPSNRSSAPSASTALYRRRNTRPALPTVPSELGAGPAARPPDDMSLEPHAPDLGIDDSPSSLPLVMLDVADPDGRSRLRNAVDITRLRDAVDTGLRSAVDIARMGVPRRPTRLIVPLVIAALVVLTMWLLY
ncbi:MAG TPA: hypothetical protein VGD37_22545 [Kofleriaceae bacterium]|jgi:hypothetical protein